MTVGIPGTGLSGLFYFLLVLWMPVREGYEVLRGKIRRASWRLTRFQLALAGSMLLLLWAEAWAIDQGLARWNVTTSAATAQSAPAVRGLFLHAGQLAAITSLAVLFVLLTGGSVAAYLMWGAERHGGYRTRERPERNLGRRRSRRGRSRVSARWRRHRGREARRR